MRKNHVGRFGGLTAGGKGKVLQTRLLLERLFSNKRQKFILAVGILSLALFYSEHFYIGKASGIIFALLLSAFTDVFFFIANHRDIKENFSWTIFIFPFFYSLAFGLFYFLVPTRILTSLMMTILYAVGLYSLFLSQNIFIVASVRTIALLSSARTVSFILTLLSYFFLANTILSFHAPIYITSAFIFFFSYCLIFHSLWTYTLEKSLKTHAVWTLGLSFCLFELTLVLWFWPANPTLLALFLTGFLYAVTGLSHVWFDKRLFRGVIWEYIWVVALVFCILLFFTFWNRTT